MKPGAPADCMEGCFAQVEVLAAVAADLDLGLMLINNTGMSVSGMPQTS